MYSVTCAIKFTQRNLDADPNDGSGLPGGALVGALARGLLRGLLLLLLLLLVPPPSPKLPPRPRPLLRLRDSSGLPRPRPLLPRLVGRPCRRARLLPLLGDTLRALVLPPPLDRPLTSSLSTDADLPSLTLLRPLPLRRLLRALPCDDAAADDAEPVLPPLKRRLLEVLATAIRWAGLLEAKARTRPEPSLLEEARFTLKQWCE